jgi:hypothetical protein
VRPRSPKRWSRPRSRRWREEHGPDVSLTDILKETYPQAGGIEYRRPEWARTARKFGWMTIGEFYALKPEPTGRTHPGLEMLYGESPFLRMLKKQPRSA